MEGNYLVYKAKAPSGKCYYGITQQSFDKRRKQHEYKARCGSEVYFHCALRKYGAKVVWSVLCQRLSKEYACEIEQILIAAADGTYNMTVGGEGVAGCKWTPEMRKTLSERLKGKPLNIKHRQAISQARLGMKFSDKHRANISAGKLGHVQSLESRQKRSKALKGKLRPSDVVAKISAAKKGCSETKAHLDAIRPDRRVLILDPQTGITYLGYAAVATALGKSKDTVGDYLNSGRLIKLKRNR